MNKPMKIGLIIVCVAFLAFIIFMLTPAGVRTMNNYRNAMNQARDDTSYETQKKVEDTARAMISSYKSDKVTYETYITSSSEEEQSWAKQAKIRANTTANSYNEYILKNSYVWADNIPEDIMSELPLLQ